MGVVVGVVVNKKPIKQLILNRLWYVLNCGFCGGFCGFFVVNSELEIFFIW